MARPSSIFRAGFPDNPERFPSLNVKADIIHRFKHITFTHIKILLQGFNL